MKLVAYSTKKDSTIRRGAILTTREGQKIASLPGSFNDLTPAQLDEARASLRAVNPEKLPHLTDVVLHKPLPAPGKIICIGLNYLDHVIESGAKVPAQPVVFSKWSNALASPNEKIILDGTSQQVDYEAELAFVVGKTAYNVPEDEAYAYIAGYMCANDVSARDLQFAESQWVRGKSLNGFCPLGPFLVTIDEIPDPHNLRIMCRVNGQTLQDSNTGQLIFKIPYLLMWLSKGITLNPGDVVLTGTPPGVGFARKPPIYLQPGDVCEIEIEKLGILRNPFGALDE
jgi:2-keto-4-pentenoate hydratase/2-oxohepta-3-ene-1,7-dioic acid hydratase in catechol pathway